MKILWVSRHTPHPRQIDCLRDIHGKDTIVELEPRPFDDARTIVRRFRGGNFDEMVIVAPLSVIAVVCNEGIRPLWSESVEETNPAQIDFRGGQGKGFRFVRFRRIKKVALEFEDD